MQTREGSNSINSEAPMKMPVLLLVLASASALAFSTNYMGADAILQQLVAKTAITNETAATGKQLQDDIKAFPEKATKLEPEGQALGWLELVDRLWTLSRADLTKTYDAASGEQLNIQQLVEALPPPLAWDELARQLESKKTEGSQEKYRAGLLKLLAHLLVNNQSAALNDVAELSEIISEFESHISEYAARELQEVVQKINTIAGNKSGIREAFEMSMRLRQNADSESSLNVPDLVTLLGEEEAERLLRKAVVLPQTTLYMPLGDETKAVARRVAVELIDKIQTPQWSLAASLHATELYEALDKKFPMAESNTTNDSNNMSFSLDPSLLSGLGAAGISSFKKMMKLSRSGSWEDRARREARIYYMLGLIVDGRTDDARNVALQMAEDADEIQFPYDALNQLEKAGYVDEVHAFLQEMLTEKPDLPLWEKYIELAAKVGRTEEMLKLVRANVANASISESRRHELDWQLARALLAADRPDEAVEPLRKILNDKNYADQDKRLEVAIQLARLGHLLKRTEWLDEGVAAARQAIEKSGDNENSATLSAGGLPELLMEAGRGPEAEEIYAKILASKMEMFRNVDSRFTGDTLSGDMIALASLYYDAGRLQDILKLADASPWWGVRDLADVRSVGNYGGHGSSSRGAPVTQAVAAALHAAGRDEEAVKILENIILSEGGYDPAYELYVAIKGPAAIPFLDSVYQLDRYEERPLIWKAHILRKQGQLDEAEKAARDAIAIDPSDGEQGKGRRMRVYGELAEILAAKGDAQNAAFFGEVVKAIRIAEEADDVYEAGLLTRGIAQYREALGHFADAYCIQSRMAVQLEQLGQYAEAEKHYQRAYELMPDSFGRVESHCFGCEGVFHSDRAQGIAERIFSSLAEKTPQKPQVHYLLGYLRDAQGRYPEALAEFRKAVELDPEYLNAWKQIGEVENGCNCRLRIGMRLSSCN